MRFLQALDPTGQSDQPDALVDGIEENGIAPEADGADGLLLGCGSVLGAFPGFSRVGCMMTAAAIGGLDRAYAMEMSLLLSIPVLAGLLVFDLFALLAGQIALSLVTLIFYLVYAAMALLGSWLTIILMRYLAQKIGFTGFAYYSLGLALFSFIFYLVI